MSNRERYMWCLTDEAPGYISPDDVEGCWDLIVGRFADDHELVPLDKALTKRGERRRRVKK